MARRQRCCLISCPVGVFLCLFFLYISAFAASPHLCWLVWLESRHQYAVLAGITAVSIAQRGNESSATGPPALPPPPVLLPLLPPPLLSLFII